MQTPANTEPDADNDTGTGSHDDTRTCRAANQPTNSDTVAELVPAANNWVDPLDADHPQNRIKAAKKQTDLSLEAIGSDPAVEHYVSRAAEALEKATNIIEQRETSEGRIFAPDPDPDNGGEH